jgi:Leucine-rich repeat (LRR) protein
MKIKSLLLLGLMTMCGMTAWATKYYTYKGVVYEIDDIGAKKAQVVGVSADWTSTSVTIPKEMVDDNSETRDVVSFMPNWYNAGTYDGGVHNTKDAKVAAGLTELSVDVTNIGILEAAQVSALGALDKLTITGHYVSNNYRLTKGLNTNMTELDLANLKGYNKVLIESVDPQVKKITLPNQGQPVDIIAEAFKGGALEAIDLTGVAEVGASAFENCTSLEAVKIASSVTSIGENAFAGTNALKTLNIDNSTLTAIPDEMFENSPIETLSIKSSSLTAIGANAFAAYKATTIDLSQCTSLATISASSFRKATNYEVVKLEKTAINQANFEKIFGASGWLASSADYLTTITLPDAVTAIPEGAFASFSKLKTINLNNVTEIKKNAFNGSALKEIALDKVTTIGESAFEACLGTGTDLFTKLTIPASVTTVGANAFKGMTNLAEVTVIGSFDDLGAWFVNDAAIKKVTIPSDSKVKKIVASAFASAAAGDAEVKIETSTLTEIGDEAFVALPITTLTLNTSGLTKIGAKAFAAYTATTLNLSNCTSLATVAANSFPANAYKEVKLEGTQIDDANFTKIVSATGWLANSKDATTGLQTITLPEKITAIPEGAFAGFKRLTSIDITKTQVGKIKDNAFNGSALNSINLSSVTEIGVSAFEGCTNFTELKNLGNVTSIGANAFKGMSTLAEVEIINDKLTKIDKWFESDGLITKLTLTSASVTEIAADAFKDAKIETLNITAPKLATIASNAFASVTITEVNFNHLTELATVADDAFNANKYTSVLLTGTKLTSVPTCFLNNDAKATLTALGLPANMTVVAGLDGLTALKAIKLPKRATEIADDAFNGCTALESIAIPALVTKIGKSAFYDTGLGLNNGLVDFSAATALETIDEYAFAKTHLTEVKIPATLAVINKNVFAENPELANVDFSEAASLTEIKDDAFNNDPQLKTLNLTGANKLATVTGKSFPKNAYEVVLLADPALDDTSFPIAQQWLTNAKGSLTKITLPEGLTTIGGFAGFTVLEGIGLPTSVKTIQDKAFQGCVALKGIKIKKNVETIGEYAFQGCDALAAVNLSDATALTEIKHAAFADNANLTAIDFAGATKLAKIGEGAFYGDGLTTVKITGSIEKLEKQAFYKNALESIDFDDASALTTIGTLVFVKNDNLDVINLSGATALTSIDAEAFPQNAYKTVKTAGTALTTDKFNAAFHKDVILKGAKETLTEITFPKDYDVASFVDFPYFTKLATIALPEGITEIPDDAFKNSNFTSFIVPATVTKIGARAFQNCAQLANVDFSQATALTEMGVNVFEKCTELKAVGLPKNLEAIPDYAFYQSGLTGIKIKNKVATIGESAFQDCANLAAVNFSDAVSLTEIKKNAFADDPKLAAVDFAGATALATIGESAFNNDALTTVKVTGSIKTIGKYAFKNNVLESLDFNDASALTTIDDQAFIADAADKYSKFTTLNLDGATALEKVAIDAFPKNKYTSVKTAGTLLAGEAGDPAVYYDNFSGSTTLGLAPFTMDNILSASDESLTELTFPAGYKMEGYDDDLAFFKNLTSISLPADLTEIPDNAFKKANITSFVVSEKIVRVGKHAFDGSALKSIDFSNATALETIDNYAFANTANLEAVGLPKNLTVINENVFEGSAIKGIKIKNRVKEIQAHAFKDAANLAQVNFEDARSLETIGGGAFLGTALTEIDLSNAISLTEVVDDPTYGPAFPQNNYTKVLLAGTALDDAAFSAPFKKFLANSQNSLEEITLPQGLTEIANDQFNGFAKLTAIGLPTGVTSIGDGAFMNSGLVGIKIKKNVKTIGLSAFEGCVDLAAVNMTEATALTSIGRRAFANCYAEDASGNAISGLTSIVIPAKVEKILQGAFNGCKLLATADFSQAAALELIGGNAFAKTALTSVDLSACANLETMNTGAFPANEYTSVKLGGTILDDASFKNFDFSGATATLAELTLPETITIIPADWFGEQHHAIAYDPKDPETWMPFSALTTVAIPEGVVTIDDNAFQGAALATVDFSAATALTVIGANAFQKTALAEVAIPANADDKKTLTIRQAAFADCANLTSFTAESWAGALANRLFQNCVSLPSIEIPAAITNVGNMAFDGCENLATVTFKHAKKADKLTKIGNYAFRNCAALTALDLSKTKLVNLDSKYPFEGCTALAEITFPDELLTINSDGIFADAPIENFEAPYLTSCGVLFGEYRKFDDEDPSIFLGYSGRDKDNANTTLKSVKIGGSIPSGCFAFCTALEDVEWFDNGVLPVTVTPGVITYPVDEFAFSYCTSLKTFTYQPENNIEDLMVDDNAFYGCLPYVLFATNSNYLDYVATWHKGAAPLNTTFGEVDITKVQTVQDKANASQFVAKYVNNGPQPVYIDANDAKVYSIYVDGDKAYFQALRTYDGKYVIQPQSWAGYAGVTGAGFNSHVIIVTKEAKEVSIHRMFLNEIYERLFAESSIGHDDVYDSQEGDDLAIVQYKAKQAAPGVAQNYLYRLTNTSGVGFGFTAFTGTTVKEGQFFIACSRKPNGAGRLEVVWLDEDGNVEGEATGINTVKNIDINDGAIYNLQGVRVDNPVKGRVYIQNGKKIVVK